MAEPRRRIELVVASPPHRRDIAVEIYVDGEQWAELHDDLGHPVAEFYGRPSGEPWVIPPDQAQDALKRAAAELESRPRRSR